MENTKIEKNDKKTILDKIKNVFSNCGDNTFFVAQYTDKFDIGIWNKNVIENTNKLLELRVFDKDKEWKLFRSDIGKDFSYRFQGEEDNKGEGLDYFDEVQLLDIDITKSSKGKKMMCTTAGGKYNLPKDISDLDRAAIRVRHYFGVDNESGQAFIRDYRLVDFESAKKRDYSNDLKGV
jgi:hypothetical protein